MAKTNDFEYLNNIEHKPIETKIIGKTTSREETLRAAESKRSFEVKKGDTADSEN